ncbi:MAG: ABC transporter ATP-binding protein [Anaerolineae bacterium]|nr:MAG: ABC transporter ATP-binding protein [Anaerolineae bacterium]
MSETVIETRNLTKKYGDFVAVDNLNLRIQKGEVFGLLGPNGAGKTTTLLMLLGLSEPTAGEVRVLGLDPARQPLSVKARVGYLPDQIGFYDDLTARENLIYIAKLNGIPRHEIPGRVDDVLARVGLSDVADHRVRTFSRGMRQRLGLADVLIKRPQLIIMDEPTQGLDPELAQQFLRMIRDLKEEEITILISSHLLDQVQAVCDRVGLFHRGRMVLEGTVPELGRKVLGGAYRIRLRARGKEDAILEALQSLPGAVRAQRAASDLYEIEAESDVRSEAAAAVVKAGGKLFALDIEAQNLNDIYARYFEEVKHGPVA